jgi:hypothetical protein
MRPRFRGKEIRFITHQMERRTGKVNLLKLCHSTSERKRLLFKGDSGIQFDYKRHVHHGF